MHFLLFPVPHSGALVVAFFHAIKTNPHLYPGVGDSGFTWTSALAKKATVAASLKILQLELQREIFSAK